MSNCSPMELAFKVFEPAEKGTASDLILLHGITACKETWDEIAQDLADRSKRRTYALDMRNHGNSAWTDEFEWRIMAEDVSHFMDKHSIKSATLIGHSMGGIISMSLALVHPEKVDSMVIEDISPKLQISKEIPESITSLIDMLQDGLEKITPDMDFETALKNMLEEISKKIPKDDTQIINAVKNDVNLIVKKELQIPPEHHEKMANGMKHLLTNKEGRLKLKTNADAIKAFLSDEKRCRVTGLEGVCEKHALFIYGTMSQFKVMDDKDYILELFPKATFQALEGATHLMHIEYPKEYTERVLQFLNN